MKHSYIPAALLVMVITLVAASGGEPPVSTAKPSSTSTLTPKPQAELQTPLPKEGLVPDKETAIKIAEAVLFRLYGEEAIIAQRPYTVKEENDIWWINGNIKAEELGFTFKIAISKQTGAILHLSLY